MLTLCLVHTWICRVGRGAIESKDVLEHDGANGGHPREEVIDIESSVSIAVISYSIRS